MGHRRVTDEELDAMLSALDAWWRCLDQGIHRDLVGDLSQNTFRMALAFEQRRAKKGDTR